MTTFIAGIAVGMVIDLIWVVILRRKFRDALDILIERIG